METNMKKDNAEWWRKWSEELEKKRTIFKASWKGSFEDWKENCPELKQRLVILKSYYECI